MSSKASSIPVEIAFLFAQKHIFFNQIVLMYDRHHISTNATICIVVVEFNNLIKQLVIFSASCFVPDNRVTSLRVIIIWQRNFARSDWFLRGLDSP